MSLRPSRKLRNLNVWQRGIEHYRAGQRDRGAASGAPAQRGWAKALFRRLLGRRATGAPGNPISVGEDPRSVAIGRGVVWVGNHGDGTLSRIDPALNDVSATVPIGGPPEALGVDPASGAAWVLIGEAP